MLSKKLEKALNKQINEEFFSAYLYMSMSAYYSSIGLDGFAHWMSIQFEEEMFHARKMYDYVIERGAKVELQAIAKPQTEWKDAVEVFEETLKHEQHITGCINKLMDLSLVEKDHATVSFLQWFIDEQVEEESTVDNILGKLKLTKGEGQALFMIDKELSTRVFTPPAQ